MKFPLLTLAGAAVLAAACSTTPPRNAALENARAAYLAASSSPQAAASAPVELTQARSHLGEAENAWRQGDDSALVAHHAYLARQLSLIAEERGKLTSAQQKIQTASEERNRVLLEDRERLLTQERQRREQAVQAQRQAQERLAQTQGWAAGQAEHAAALERQLEQQAGQAFLATTLGDVLFDVGESTLKPGAERSLDRLAEFLEQHPQRKVRVEGYTDSSGPAEVNRELSRQRAEEVGKELTARGIEPERIEAVGHGESFPIASNANPAGRQLNRRVEIILSDGSGNLSRR